MKRIAFIFTHSPHGNSTGREGLDALLAISALTNNVGVFFISDGVLILISQQYPEKILARNFTATFGILSLYDINKFYICAESAMERGLNTNTELILNNIKWLSTSKWRKRLNSYDNILMF